MQSVLPRARRDTARVESLKRRLRSAVAGDAEWVDVYRYVVGGDGSIGDVYSDDDLHLREEGYAVWYDVIEPYVVGGADT